MQDFRLAPQTRLRLRQYQRRRSRLILLRGVCAVTAILIGSMLVIVALDWWTTLPDWLRLALSSAAYASALVTAWFTCVRLLLHMPSERQLARLIESGEPGLREDLLSAVELGAPDADPRFDSPLFRALLQKHVAHRMQGVRLGRVLPWRLVRGWFLAALLLLAVCVALVLAPWVRFPHRIARALLPTANLARLSRVQVTVRQPNPADTTVPHGEPVTVEVDLSGPKVSAVRLETRTSGGARQQLDMKVVEQRRYAAVIQVGRESLTWRVRAGDAVTRYYDLASRPRPFVRQFQKTYQYPDYAALPDRSVTETSGDLQALEGSIAEIIVTPDQPVSRGHLVVERQGQSESVALAPTDGGRLLASLTLDQNGTYQVQLTAAETGFESRFAPHYQITVEPDLAPTVSIRQPKGPLLAAADDILNLSGTAEDDLPLTSVQQWIQVNQQEWQRLDLPAPSDRRIDIAQTWDLLDLKLTGGDRVETKLVAVDRKGQVTESAPLQLTIRPAALDTRRHAALTEKERAASAVQQYARSSQTHITRAKEILQSLADNQAGEAQRQLYAVNVLESAARLTEDANTAQRVLVDVLRRMPNGSEAYDLLAAAAALTAIKHRAGRDLACQIHEMQQATEPDARKRHLDASREALDRAHHYAQQTDQWLTAVLNADMSAVTLDDLFDVARFQQRSMPSEDLSKAEAKLARRVFARRETVVDEYLAALDTTARPTVERLNHGQLRDALAAIAAVRRHLEPLASRESPGTRLLVYAEQLTQTIQRVRTGLQPAFAEAADRLGKARPSFCATTAESVARQLSSTQSVLEQSYQLHDSRPTPDAEHARRRLTSAEGPAAVESLRARAALEEVRPDADRQFVSDLDTIAAAAQAILVRASESFTSTSPPTETSTDPRKQFTELVQSAAVLATRHDVFEMLNAVHGLMENEKWLSSSALMFTQQGRDWDFLADRLDSLADTTVALVPAPLGKDVADRLRALARASHTSAVHQELDRRRRQADSVEELQVPLAAVQRDLLEIAKLLGAEIAVVRERLRALAPPVDRQLQQLAERAAKEEDESRQLGLQAAEQAPADTQPEAVQQRDEQQQLAEELQRILDTLRRLVHSQQLVDGQQQELAQDVDDAAALLRPPAQAADRNLQQAAQAANAPDQAKHLAEAANQQQRLAELLQQLAQHFARALAGEDVTASRAALRQAEEQYAQSADMQQMQQQVQQLSALAQLSPEDLLRALERELQRNRPMQRELDNITREILESSRRDLSEDAQSQRDMADRIERADPQVDQAGAALMEELRKIAQQARELADKKIPEVAKEGRTPTGSRMDAPLNQASAQLRTAATKAEDAAKPELSATSRSRSAPELAETLEQSARDVDQAAARAGESARQAETKRQAREKALAAVTAARQQSEESSQKSTKADQELRQATEQRQAKRREADTAQNSARQAARDAGRKPQDAQLAAQARQATERAEQLQKESQDADRVMQVAQSAAQQAKSTSRVARQQLENAERQLRSAPEPTAQEQQQATAASGIQTRVQETAAQVRQLAEQARRLGQTSEQIARSAVPSSDTLKQAAEDMKPLAREVAGTSQDLARASRHETRLQNAPAGEAINEVAQQTAATSQEKLPDVARRVAAAPTAVATREPLEESGRGLDAHAAQIDRLLGAEPAPLSPSAEMAAAEPAKSGSPEPGATPPSDGDPASNPANADPAALQNAGSPESLPFTEPQTAQWLARTLDTLDRALHQAPSAPADPNAAQGEAAANAQAESAAALAAALRAQAGALQAARTADAAMASLNGDMPGAPESEGLAQAGEGAAVEAGPQGEGVLPDARPMDNEDWGRLPPSQMRDLMEGRREVISEDYRHMVEAYFRAIAEKAKGDQKR